MNFCPVCAKDQASLPISQRQQCPIPCPQHGHPGWLSDANQLAVELYSNLGGNFLLLDIQDGKQTVRKAFLDLRAVKILTDAYEADFLDMWWRIKLIHQELTEHG